MFILSRLMRKILKKTNNMIRYVRDRFYWRLNYFKITHRLNISVYQHYLGIFWVFLLRYHSNKNCLSLTHDRRTSCLYFRLLYLLKLNFYNTGVMLFADVPVSCLCVLLMKNVSHQNCLVFANSVFFLVYSATEKGISNELFWFCWAVVQGVQFKQVNLK